MNDLIPIEYRWKRFAKIFSKGGVILGGGIGLGLNTAYSPTIAMRLQTTTKIINADIPHTHLRIHPTYNVLGLYITNAPGHLTLVGENRQPVMST